MAITCPLGVLFAFIFISSGISQDFNLQEYVVTQFGMEQGLPQSSVNDIHQSQDGYIWLATFGGLVRFDGHSLTTFNRSNTKGMRSDRILNIYEDSKGYLWLGTEDGFLRFKDGNSKSYIIRRGSQIYSPLKVAEDTAGTLWLSVHGTPYKSEGDTFVEVPVLTDSVSIQKANNDPTGVVLAHDLEILKTTGDEIVQIADLSDYASYNFVDVVEYPKGSGSYFLATTGEGILRYKDGEPTFYSVESGLISRYAKRLYVDRDQNLWAVTYDGIHRWNGSGFEAFDVIHSSDEIQFSAFTQDNEGNYWAGTPSKGFYKIRPSVISTISYDQGLNYESMLSISKLNDGKMLFSTNCGGVYEWDGERAIYSAVNSHLPNLCNWSVFEDSKGRIWFGSRILYVTESLDRQGTIIGEEDGFSGVDIFAITEDSKGNIWIGSLNGLFRYDGEQFQHYTTEDGLSYNDVRVIFEDTESETLWIGTSAGLNTYQNGQIRHYELLEFVDDTLNTREPYIRAIYKDDEGTIWLGSYGSGIFRIDDGHVTHITQEDGLFDDIVSHIVEDENGNFWMGSNRGISRVHKTELNNLIDGTIESVQSYSYGASDGMHSPETNGGFQPSTLTDSFGNIYFPTVAGVAVVSTRDVSRNELPPSIYIENLRTSDNEIPLSSAITLPYDNSFLEIKYTAINFTDPGKVEFKYKIEGLHGSWLDAGANRSAMFSNLPSGEYTFQVIASNDDGIWNTDGATLAITVIPPFWQTNWFYSLVALLFLTSGPTVYFVRVKNLESENKRQKSFTEQLIESQESERRRIASELHDGLGQQILVIKNRAELAKMQSDKADVLEDQLNEIMQSAVSSIQSVRDITHGLRPVHLEKFGLTEAIENLCEQLQRTSKMEWSYHVENIDRYIPKNKEINFYRVIQEGTNNILKHSLANEASVIVKVEDSVIKAVIWDDGKGFDLQQLKLFAGLGFLGMKERTETLGGTLQIHSEIEKGTTLTIEIPSAKHE
ncbi:MAG: two-component regulator propeller domain-containing protein [Balneolaceae bacterium]